MSSGEFHKLHLSRTCSSQNPHFKEVAALPGRASPKLKFRGCPTNNKPFTSTGRWSVTRGGLRTLTLTAAFPCEGPSHVSAPPVRHERPQDLRTTLRYSCLPIVLGVLTSSTLDTEIPFFPPITTPTLLCLFFALFVFTPNLDPLSYRPSLDQTTTIQLLYPFTNPLRTNPNTRASPQDYSNGLPSPDCLAHRPNTLISYA